MSMPIKDPNQRQAQFRIEDTTEVLCEHCGHNIFSVGAYMRKVSPILTGNGKPAYIPVEEAVYCVKCHQQNEEFILDGFKKKSIIST